MVNPFHEEPPIEPGEQRDLWWRFVKLGDMPMPGKLVIVCVKKKIVTQGVYTGSKWTVPDCPVGKVTHWMPIPAPPKFDIKTFKKGDYSIPYEEINDDVYGINYKARVRESELRCAEANATLAWSKKR